MDLFNEVMGQLRKSKGSNYCPREEQAKGTRLGGLRRKWVAVCREPQYPSP